MLRINNLQIWILRDLTLTDIFLEHTPRRDVYKRQVGFRVNSHQGIRFRQWANNVLKEYRSALNGSAFFEPGRSISGANVLLAPIRSSVFVTRGLS